MSESSENSEVHSAAESQRKLTQHHIERIKKEEEEEQWISGEELYTEGSSDEDDAALRAKRRGKAIRKNRRATPLKEKEVKQKEEQSMIDSAASPETSNASKNSSHIDNPDALFNSLISEPKLEDLSLSDEELQDSEGDIVKTAEAFCINYAQSDQSRPQNEKSCHGVTSDLQSAFLEMEKYDNLLEFMTKKEREARETTNQLMLQTKNTLIELNASQKLNGQLARNIKSFVILNTEETNHQEKSLVLQHLNGDGRKSFKAEGFIDCCYTSSPQKQRAATQQRPSSTNGDTKTRSIQIQVQSAITQKKSKINFIQRNIESVSANIRAPLTDEEKQQFAVLLKEIEGSIEDTITENSLLYRKLNENLGADLESNYESEAAFVMLTQEENEKVKHLLEDVDSDAKYKYSYSKQKLMDIDKSLAALQTTALEEVDPVGEDEIKNLVAGYYKENHPQNLQEEELSSDKSILDSETLQGLLNQASKDLPNFKYKYKV